MWINRNTRDIFAVQSPGIDMTSEQRKFLSRLSTVFVGGFTKGNSLSAFPHAFYLCSDGTHFVGFLMDIVYIDWQATIPLLIFACIQKIVLLVYPARTTTLCQFKTNQHDLIHQIIVYYNIWYCTKRLVLPVSNASLKVNSDKKNVTDILNLTKCDCVMK